MFTVTSQHGVHITATNTKDKISVSSFSCNHPLIRHQQTVVIAMPHSNDDSERIRERPEEDIIEPRPASNEFEFSNQPRRDFVEGLPATPQPQPSDQPSIRSAETEQDEPLQGPVPSSPKPSNQHPIPPAEPELNATSRKTLFGFKRQVKEQSVPTHFNRFDYEQKYPRDPFGQERAENARVWLTYLDEAESYDRDKIDGWKDTVDVLLVFAGLFSGVVTTFLSQTSQNLQQNFTQVSASLLYEMVQLQRAQLTGASIADVPNSPLTPNSSFTPSTNAFVVNGLWFTSLAISLCTALFAVLTKQWLHYYQSPVSGTARRKVLFRQFRFEGLEKWKVAVIIDLLPILLHLALGLFLIGLVVFILPLDVRIVWIIVVLSGCTYIIYLVSIILPIWYPQCPYVTPLTIYTYFFIRLFRLIRFWLIYFWLPSYHIHFRLPFFAQRLSIYQDRFFSELSLRGFQHSLHLISSTVSRVCTFSVGSITSQSLFQDILSISSKSWIEARLVWVAIDRAATTFEDKAFDWLLSTSSNPAISRIVARSVCKSPKFCGILRPYHSLSYEVHNPRFDDEWAEDSLRLLLDNSEFFEDLYHRLHLGVFSRGPADDDHELKIVSFIRERSSVSLREEIKERYPELFSLISVFRRDPAGVLLRGLQDNTLILCQGVWLCLLQEAARWPHKELASQIISSGTFNLFDWHESEQPSAHTHRTEAIHLANQLPQHLDMHASHFRSKSPELNRSGFSYLFRYFVGEPFLDDGSFESRYRLFITIYQNLLSYQPLIDDPALRTRALEYLLVTFPDMIFTCLECIRGQVITTTLINRMQRDMLMHDSFINDNMSSDLQEAAISCFNAFWEYQMRTTGDVSPLFTPQKEGLQFIYKWCLKGNRCAFVQQLFMPGNLSNLRILLLEDRDHSISNLGRCLGLLLLSSEALVLPKHWIVYEEHIIPNVINLFTVTILSGDSDPLFSVLCDPSVLAQAWELLATYVSPPPSCFYPKDRSREVLALLPSRLDPESLKKVYDLMVEHIESPTVVQYGDCTTIIMKIACISAYTFGRMVGLINDPNTFNFPSPVIDMLAFKYAFEDATAMRNELECHFMEEKRKHARYSLFQFPRIIRTFRNSLIWKKRPEVQQAETELEAVGTRV